MGLPVGRCVILEKLFNSAVVWFPQLFGGGRSAALPGPCEDDVHVRATCARMCACMRVRACVHMCAHCMRGYVYVFMRACVHTCVRMRTCVHGACAHVHVCVHVCMRVHV